MSQMRVLTFLGRALCHILAMACEVVVFQRLRPWMNVIMCGVCDGFRALM
jgi:hypothetical protein